MLIQEYHDSNCEDKTIVGDISRAIQSTLQLRSKKELIENFIEYTKPGDVYQQWKDYVRQQRDVELDNIIKSENLKEDETKALMTNALRDRTLKTTGTEFDAIMPPMRRFGGGGDRVAKKQSVIEKLIAFFEKIFGV